MTLRLRDGFLRRFGDGFDLDPDVDAVAQRQAACFQHLVPLHAEVAPQDGGLGREADSGAAPGSFWAIWPGPRQPPRKVSALLDAVVEALRNNPFAVGSTA